VTLAQLSAALNRGESRAVDLAEACTERIEASDSEGSRTFIRRNLRLTEDAFEADRVLQTGRHTPLTGIPVSVKDLFDIAGQVTTAGSVVLRDSPPAAVDSAVVARLKAAGMVIVGTTNMTEFAYSGLGLNPHYGTPRNPYDREVGRIPGGSSSGAAISVTDGMAAVAIGTDTSGSCRIPAALCGLVGFKPTARRVPRTGLIPLSTSLDSVGSIGHSVNCCALVDAVLAGESEINAPAPADLSGLSAGRLVNYVEEGVAPDVAAACELGLRRLEDAGLRIVDLQLQSLDAIPEIVADGGLTKYEAYLWHRPLLERRRDEYDPHVASRILLGAPSDETAYLAKIRLRQRMIERADQESHSVDFIVLPSVVMTAPSIDSLGEEDAYVRTNLAMLRNPGVANMLDRPAITLPIPGASRLPVGLMLMGETMGDRQLLAIARAAEIALQ